MHRTKVRVVEDALDANNTIAQANRADFDRLDHELLARRDLYRARTAGGADERRDLDLPLVLARLATQNRGHVDDFQGSALARRVLADDCEVEQQRVLDDLAQAADAQGDVRDPAPVRVLADGRHDRAG